MYLPLLSNALKAQKLRSTVSVFERSKFLFGLPRALRTHIQAGRYDNALRDYNKGLYLHSSRPNQLLPVSAAPANANAGGVTPLATSAAAAGDGEPERRRKEQQMRVINKIWGEVEKIMAEMRHELEGVLREEPAPGEDRGIEQVEKSLE